MKSLFVAMLLFLAAIAHAQVPVIKVLNAVTNEPIIGASVKNG